MSRTPLVLGVLLAFGCTREPNKENPNGTASASPSGTPNKPGAPPAADQIPAPPDVAAPPADAEKTKSGLAFKILKHAEPKDQLEHPEPNDDVTVHYTGWTTDGKMFDSSVARKQPATFGVTKVIPGWTEGLQLMVPGEQRRFWIPVELAYKHQPGRPDGMLVFDVELLSIKKGPKAPEDVKEIPPNATKTESGLGTRVLTAGTGTVHPTDADVVKFHAIGFLSDGTFVISTEQRGMPIAKKLKELPPGIIEGLKMMVVGEKRRMWIPPKLAVQGPGAQEPANMLVFDITLVEITTPLAADDPKLKAPADVAAPPPDAEKTKSGLASKVLTKGTGKDHPAASDRVAVNYIGWQTDGHMFDTSLTKPVQPIEFSLGGVIPGWTEGVQLMVEGEKRRFWIPQDLAYKGGEPKGMLVFDIELLKIVKPAAPPK
jgi:FKBP-type peptidyl-prolyl cis-trans isomerase